MTDTALLAGLQDLAREAGAEGGREAMHEVLSALRDTKALDIDMLRSPRQFVEECPVFTIHRVQKMLARADKNNMRACGAAFKVDGRWVIHRAKFDAWFRDRYDKGANRFRRVG